MKVICVFLTILMLHLSIVPCMDQHDAKDNVIGSVLKVTQKEEQRDTCSPFCSCNCCQNVMFSILIYDIPISVQIPTKMNIAHFVCDFISSEYSFIWQPPKIA